MRPMRSVFWTRKQHHTFAELLSESAINHAGIFEPASIAQLHSKCRGKFLADPGTVFSNADNMAMVGIVSCQLLHRLFVADRAEDRADDVQLTVDIDRVHH